MVTLTTWLAKFSFFGGTRPVQMTSDRRVKLVFVDELGRHVLRARGFTSCWFLVPPSARLVGDLAHEIRAEFGLSATRCPAGVDLVLEQRHLVPSHDVRIVRDDDEIHVQSAVALTLESDGHNDSDESEIVVRATELVARPSRKAKKSTIDRRDLTNAQKKERKTAEEARVVAKTLKRQQKEKEDGEKRKQRQEKELLVRLTASNNHSSSSSEEEGDNAAASKKRKAVDSSSSSSSSESSDSESSDAAVGPAKAAHTQQREQKRQRLRTNTAAAPAQALAHAAKATGDSDKEPQKQRRRRRPRNRKPREPLRATTGATTADGEALLPPYSTEIPPVDGVTRGHVRFGVARDAHVIAHVASSGLRSARRPRELVSPELQKYGPSPSTLSSREQLRDLEPQDVNGALDAEQSTQHHDQQKDASGKARAGEAAASHSSTKKAKMKLGTMWKRPYEIVASIHGSEAEDATRAVPSMVRFSL